MSRSASTFSASRSTPSAIARRCGARAAPGVTHQGDPRGGAGSAAARRRSNTAGRALHRDAGGAARCEFGFELELDKGIPLASGLGGSAASAVAAVVAANALLAEPRSQLELLKYAMQGEAVASGSMHVDNIAPSLFGGLVLTVGIDHPRVKQIPVPRAIRAVIVHPHMFLSTRQARAILKRQRRDGGLRLADGAIWPASSPAATPTIWTCCASRSRTW